MFKSNGLRLQMLKDYNPFYSAPSLTTFYHTVKTYKKLVKGKVNIINESHAMDKGC